MKNKFLYILFVVFFFVICDEHIFAVENFFSEGKVKYENKKYEEANYHYQKEENYKYLQKPLPTAARNPRRRAQRWMVPATLTLDHRWGKHFLPSRMANANF